MTSLKFRRIDPIILGCTLDYYSSRDSSFESGYFSHEMKSFKCYNLNLTHRTIAKKDIDSNALRLIWTKM